MYSLQISMEATKLQTSDTDQLRMLGSTFVASNRIFLLTIFEFVGGDKSKASETATATGLFLVSEERLLKLGVTEELDEVETEGATVPAAFRKLLDRAKLSRA